MGWPAADLALRRVLETPDQMAALQPVRSVG
jgi:hypothetical protein